MRVLRAAIAGGQLLNWLAVADAERQQPLIQLKEQLSTSSQWNLNFSSSAPHFFASVYGLLQQWPNTFFPNGHSIAPCEIPPLTKLYHGRMDAEVPPSPEWVAFDIAMAYGIMGGSRNSHMLTYQTTRRAKCLYFDGESATLFGSGQLDTQMLHIWGNLSGPARPGGGFRGLYDEYARANGLCTWLRDKGLGGLGWGYEGIVRMNAGFEMIWCNFSSPSMRLVSHLNVTAPLLNQSESLTGKLKTRAYEFESKSYFPLPPVPTRTDHSTDPTDPPSPPVGGRDRWAQEPFFNSQAWNWFSSSTAHYGSSGDGPGLGEARVKILSCGFLSYYSPVFMGQNQARAETEQKQLNLTDVGHWKGQEPGDSRALALNSLTRRRRYHGLSNVTSSNAAIMRADSERVLRDLSSSKINCSGIDWTMVTNDIVQTYASPIAIFSKSLESFGKLPKSNMTALFNLMVSVRDQSHTLLLPFLEYPDENSHEDVWTRGSALFNETFSRCQFQYTRLLDPAEGIILGPEEWLLKWAVEETTGSICSVLVEIGLSVEAIWQSQFSIFFKKSWGPLSKGLSREISRWTEGVQELMAWLGWAGEWVRCEEKCTIDEKCFIPMWPMIPRGNFGPGKGYPPRYGRPGYGYPPYHGYLSNRTGRGPGPGWWQQDEATLWNPICVKSDYILNG